MEVEDRRLWPSIRRGTCVLEAYNGVNVGEAVAAIPSAKTCPLPWPSFKIIPL
jgi:hypothetical protein